MPVQDGYHGYRLHFVPDLLDLETVCAGLNSAASTALQRIDRMWLTDSTNQRLLERWSEPGGAHGHVLFAEFQQFGRGRHGRTWVAPLAGGLCLSLAWRFPEHLTVHLGTLAIAAGIAGVRLLHGLGLTHTALKWPNDLMVDGSKIGGILVETRICGRLAGTVIGMGLNVQLRRSDRALINQAHTDLAELLDVVPSRNIIAAELLNHLVAVLHTLTSDGPARLLTEWRSYVALIGRSVRLQSSDDRVWEGVVQDITADGALILEHDGIQETFNCGELSLREVT